MCCNTYINYSTLFCIGIILLCVGIFLPNILMILFGSILLMAVIASIIIIFGCMDFSCIRFHQAMANHG